MRRPPCSRPAPRRSGMTLLEIMLALSLVAIVLYKGMAIMGQASEASRETTASTLIEERSQIVLERIARAIMGSTRESLSPATEAPLSTDQLRYQVNLGIEAGEVVWSDPETIGLENLENEIYWSRTPEAGPEQRVLLTRAVRPFLEGELPNGMDDNGNGLIDEKGLSFVVDRNAVHIRLTLERVDPEGRLLTKTVQTTVTCRNPATEVTP